MAHFGNWSWEIKADSITWSDEVYRIHGISLNTAVNYEKLMEVIHPEDRDCHNEHTTNWVKNRGGDPFEYRVVHPDGSIRHILVVGYVECDENGDPVRLVGTLRRPTSDLRFLQTEKCANGIGRIGRTDPLRMGTR